MHGPAAIARVTAALNDAGILTTAPVVTSITGIALDVAGLTEAPLDRDAGIESLAYRWGLNRAHAAHLLDLAVEALTATPQE